MSKFGEWKKDSWGNHYREVFGPFECGEFFCDDCGDCLRCEDEFGWDGHLHRAFQYAHELETANLPHKNSPTLPNYRIPRVTKLRRV